MEIAILGHDRCCTHTRVRYHVRVETFSSLHPATFHATSSLLLVWSLRNWLRIPVNGLRRETTGWILAPPVCRFFLPSSICAPFFFNFLVKGAAALLSRVHGSIPERISHSLTGYNFDTFRLTAVNSREGAARALTVAFEQINGVTSAADVALKSVNTTAYPYREIKYRGA